MTHPRSPRHPCHPAFSTRSDVRPGSTHDLTAARELVLPALYPHVARGLPVRADKGYTGAGVGIHTPIKRQPEGPLHIDNRCYNQLITAYAHRPNAATPCSDTGAPSTGSPSARSASALLPQPHWS